MPREELDPEEDPSAEEELRAVPHELLLQVKTNSPELEDAVRK